MRLIDADEFKKQMAAMALISPSYFTNKVVKLLEIIDKQPPVEAVPVVHGEWVADERGIYFCSTCDSEAYWDTDYGQQLFNHCPYCGADMRKEV